MNAVKIANPKFHRDLLKEVQTEYKKVLTPTSDMRSFYFERPGNPFYLDPGSFVKINYLNSATETKENVFTGMLICAKGVGAGKTITVRAHLAGVFVEKIIPIYNPLIKEIKVLVRDSVEEKDILALRDEKSGRYKKASEIKSSETVSDRISMLMEDMTLEEKKKWRSFRLADHWKAHDDFLTKSALKH